MFVCLKRDYLDFALFQAKIEGIVRQAAIIAAETVSGIEKFGLQVPVLRAFTKQGDRDMSIDVDGGIRIAGDDKTTA